MPDDPAQRDVETVALDEDPPEPDEDDDLPGIDRPSDVGDVRRPPFRVMTDVARLVLPVAVVVGVVGAVFVGKDGSPVENRVFWSGLAALLLYQAGFALRYRTHAQEAGLWVFRSRGWGPARGEGLVETDVRAVENKFDVVLLAGLDVLLAAVALLAGWVLFS